MKYFAKKVKYNDLIFDSKTELKRYLELQALQAKGKISDLKLQVRFEIIPPLIKEVEVKLKTKTKIVQRVDEKAAHYTCDFTYIKDDMMIIEEIKSEGTMRARDYPLRRKLIKALLNKRNKELGKEYYRFNEIVI